MTDNTAIAVSSPEIDDAQIPFMTDRDLMENILREVRALARRVDQLESEAKAMVSPDKLMELATGFLGGGSFPGGF